MPDTLQHTRAIARGDREALARLYRERFDRMYCWARVSTGRDEAFCLDVVHDSFLRIIRAMKPLESEAALNAYLRRTVISCAIDALRREQRRARHHARHATQPREITEAAPPGDGADLPELLNRLREQLAEVDALTAQLIRSRHAGGLTLASIGRAFGLTASAVDGRLNRAQSRLRASLASKEDAGD